jgi:hypothetical protein
MRVPKHVGVTVQVTNSLNVARKIVLEPWTTECWLNPGGVAHILVEGDPKHPLGLELFQDQVIVHALDSEGARLSFVGGA